MFEMNTLMKCIRECSFLLRAYIANRDGIVWYKKITVKCKKSYIL